ncbi:glycosyltransferase [Roseiterribacter gracilis]|uniref:glycosyltransferase n=1 Tax=Roseiterribacter gracilis TaxID=2812848 RepID=UPI003B4386F7
MATASGLGQAARLQLAAFAQAGVDVRGLDLSAAFMAVDESAPSYPPAAPGEDGVLLLHANGPFARYALAQIGRARLGSKRVVGYWAWELPRLPDDWRDGFAAVHEIWVPSRFTQQALVDAPVPVRVVPYPVALGARGVRDRASFGFADGEFVVLVAFDMASTFARKNPLGAIDAFQRAFGADPRARLVLKVSNAERAPAASALVSRAIDGFANMQMIAEKWPHARVTSLIASSDVVLSLHRAEGFGLVPAEAMLDGVPVVATGWSGNLDFMTPENSALVQHGFVPAIDSQGTYDHGDQLWADPDLDDAARQLRRLFDDPSLRHAMTRRARADAERLFGGQAFLDAIGRDWLARWVTRA